MSKPILIIFTALALNGCAVVTWTHPTKGSGSTSVLSTKGSAEFKRDYQDCEEIVMQYTKSDDKPHNPCLAAREHTRCMKEKHSWEIDKDTTQ